MHIRVHGKHNGNRMGIPVAQFTYLESEHGVNVWNGAVHLGLCRETVEEIELLIERADPDRCGAVQRIDEENAK